MHPGLPHRLPAAASEDEDAPCPDYEEVRERSSGRLAMKGLVYNLASEGIFKAEGASEEVSFGRSDPRTKEKIMSSEIYCIHKVNYLNHTLVPKYMTPYDN